MHYMKVTLVFLCNRGIKATQVHAHCVIAAIGIGCYGIAVAVHLTVSTAL